MNVSLDWKPHVRWVWGVALALGLVLDGHAQWGAVDTTFQPGGGNNSGLDADVFAIGVQPDGKILIGGAFTKVGRVARNRVARLNADGSLDTGFDPGTGANGLVEVLLRQSDGRVLIAGRFTTVQGQSTPYLARLQPAGALDTTFGASADGFVLAAAPLPGGGFIIGGSFGMVNGVSRACVARLDERGAVDPAFNLAVDSSVHAVAVDSEGAVWLAGNFTSVQGIPRVRIARVLPNGLVDMGFDPGLGATHAITALTLHDAGRPVVGGAFTSYDGQLARYVARIRAGGGLDSSFTPEIAPVWGGVLALRTDALGRTIVGGEFYTIEGVSRVGIARLEPNGLLDRTFDPGTGVANSDGFSPIVRGVALQPDGRVLIGGRFTSVNGVKLNYLARLTGDVAVPLRITSIEPLPTHQLRLTVSGPEGAVCVLEGSSDFVAWTPTLTNQVTGGFCILEPSESIETGERYYRVVRP